MPACRDCIYLIRNKCYLLGKGEHSLIRPCVIAATVETSLRIQSGDNILEVGCGKADWVERVIDRRGGVWFGLDPEDHGRNGQEIGTVCNHPFLAKEFEGVIAISTFEHWREHGENQEDGLASIHRMLNLGGWLLITCPMFVHGAKEFVVGDRAQILGYFDPALWDIEVEDWRREYEPLPKWKGWKPRREKIMRNNGIDTEQVSSYQMIVTAVKK